MGCYTNETFRSKKSKITVYAKVSPSVEGRVENHTVNKVSEALLVPQTRFAVMVLIRILRKM